MTDTSTEFDWANASIRDCTVQQQVHRVAIYDNPHGDVVIRKERDWNEEDDPFIVIARGHALRAAHAILEAAGLGEIQFYRACSGGGGHEDVPIQPAVAHMMAMGPDIDWKAVNEEATAAGLSDDRSAGHNEEPEHVPVKERRARVEAALHVDPSRSNRSIATECGVSDKTVAAVRAEIRAENEKGCADFRSDTVAEEPQLRLVAAE